MTTVPAYALQVDAARHDRGVRIRCEVPHGSVTAVVGPNGSGKSSLIKMVSGQLRPDEGTVAIDGRLVSGPGVFVPVHRRRVALLEQRPLLFEHLDVLARAHGDPDPQANVETAMDALGIASIADQVPTTLSSGQRRRLALAMVLVRPFELLILDEPEQRLDVAGRSWLATYLRAVADQGGAVLMASHDDALIAAVRARVVPVGEFDAFGQVDDGPG